VKGPLVMTDIFRKTKKINAFRLGKTTIEREFTLQMKGDVGGPTLYYYHKNDKTKNIRKYILLEVIIFLYTN